METYRVLGEECISLALLPDQERQQCIDFTVNEMLKNRNYEQVRELIGLVEADLAIQDTQLNALALLVLQQTPNVSTDLADTIRVLEIKMEYQEMVFDGLMNVHRGVVEVLRETLENARRQQVMTALLG